MRLVEAPEYHFDTNKVSVFLAGGITDCPDWQSEVIEGLEDTDLLVYNPRRNNFPIHDPSAAKEQIEWEYVHLTQYTDIYSFWFASGDSVQPIALYELGRYTAILSERDMMDRLVIGVDPDYKRKYDVYQQLELMRYYVDSYISSDLNTHIENIKKKGREIQWKKTS